MGTDFLTNRLLGLTKTTSPFYAVYAFLIQTTIYLSVTAIFIILFKLIFKNRLKAKWHFLIWAVLLIRLIIPSLPTSPVSVFNTVKLDENTVIQSSFRSYNIENSKDDEDNYTVAVGLQKMIEDDNDDASEGKSVMGYAIQIDEIVTYVWAGGTLLLLGYFITILAVYRHKLKKHRRECDDNTLHILDICKEKLNIKRNIALYFADTTPMLIGLFKPSIYIPENLSEAEKEATLFHELSHMKHLDILWSAVATLVLCLNWFNPIMWFSFFIFKRDIEVYCDQRTLKYTENKQSYAMLLFKTATAGKEKYVPGTTSLQSGKADVKRRIRYMAKYKKPTLTITAVAVTMVTLILLCCLTNAQGEKEIASLNPTEITKNFFASFEKSDYQNMKQYCTENCKKFYFHNGDVDGMAWAKLTEIGEEKIDKNTCSIYVSVEMETVKRSALYPETSTSFFVVLIKGDDGSWLIDEFPTLPTSEFNVSLN